MEKPKNLPWIQIFALAGTFFGVLVNAAFATGGLAYSYFAKYGWTAIFFPLLSMALIVFTFWTVMNAAVNHGCRTGREWADWLYAPFHKVLGPIYDIVTVACYCMALGTGIAGVATLISDWWNVDYIICCVVYGVVIILIALGNSKTVSKVSGVMSVIIIVCMLYIYPQVIHANIETLGNYIGNRVMFDNYTW